MHRLPKVVDWPLRVLAAIGGGALFALLQMHAAHKAADAAALKDWRIGASAVLVSALVPLLIDAARRWSESAHKVFTQWAKTRAAKKEIRMATLLGHADPLKREVSQQAERIEGLEARVRCAEMKNETLMATFADVLGEAGLQKTQPLPLYLAAKDGQIVSKDQRDSA